MLRKSIILLSLAILTFSIYFYQKFTPNKQIIILKVDDLEFNSRYEMPQNFIRFIHFSKDNKIPITMGLIGESLVQGGEPNTTTLEIQNLQKRKLLEIWNHGYNHLCAVSAEEFELSKTRNYKEIINYTGENEFWEFKNTDFEYQKLHLQKTQKLAQEKLGITLTTFGTPCNHHDQTTIEALRLNPEIQNVFFFGKEVSTFKNLNNRIDLEKTIGQPNFNFFKENYNKSLPYIVIQLHPTHWTNSEWKEFLDTITYLKKHNINFLTASEAVKQLH